MRPSWITGSTLLLAMAASAAVALEPDRRIPQRPSAPAAATAEPDARRPPAPVLLSVELLPDPDSTPRAESAAPPTTAERHATDRHGAH